MGHVSEKAAQYVSQLDDARCEGRWENVLELIRKVKKHAPERMCLALTAETECAIARATTTKQQHASGTAARPSTAANAKDLDVSGQVPKLMTAVEGETRYAEDRFQAQVCIGWLHWVVGEYNLAAVRLPKSLEAEYAVLDPVDKLSEWTNVCALKAAYLKANCLARNGQRVEALTVFESGLPSLGIIWSGRTRVGQQVYYWAELFLTEFCMLASQALRESEKSLDETNSLACFRSWARYWEALAGPVAGGYGFRGSVPRRRIWREYYAALSSVLEDDLPFPTGYVGKITNEISARNQLRVELKKVEATYESLLLAETSFPRADEEREEVESFAKLAMKNWATLSGRGWRENDLGQGGRESLSRGVLDILYNAATKTFHSTAILRYLFIVHMAVAEFDLAFKALDSYLEIMKRAKARVDKTGEPDPNLDDDATLLETMSLAIVALCRFGNREAIERARDFGAELEDLLSRLPQLRTQAEESAVAQELEDDVAANGAAAGAAHPAIPPNVLAQSWQAIGLAQAHWSRTTFDASSRTEIQAKAIRCLRKSLSVEYGRSKDVRSLFALGLLLAERRELTTAIEIVKTALMSNRVADEETATLYAGQYWQERSLIPLWHLLALLLSSRQEYVMAARACEGAFEQFRDAAVLFGSVDLNYRSEHLNEAEARNEKSLDFRRGIVDDMDDTEKENILEIKMTQLALVELLEGPDVAVNASYELLNLFGRFFGNVQTKPTFNPPKPEAPPKSSAGTLRSIKGSIFGGSRHERSLRNTRQVSMNSERSAVTTESRPQTTQTSASMAPTIQITQENGHTTMDGRRSRKAPGVANRRRSESGRRISLRMRDSSSSRRRTLSTGPHPHGPTVVDGESFFTPDGDFQPQPDFFASASTMSSSLNNLPSNNTTKRQASFSSSTFSNKGRTISHLDSYVSNKSKSTDYSEVSLDATYTIANPLPIVQFSKDQERRQRSGMLVRVWLMIAGFYRRAGMYDDAKGSVAEAQKLVQGLEAEITKEVAGGGSVKLRERGWADGKSVEELWGDVWAEMGELSLAKGQPYEAKASFEAALTHFPDHPAAVVGVSNLLLDVYSEELLPPPAVPSILPVELSDDPMAHPSSTEQSTKSSPALPSTPLGLANGESKAFQAPLKPLGRSRAPAQQVQQSNASSSASSISMKAKKEDENKLVAPYKATSLPLVDRLAARDRAYALLSGLTKLGSGWNYTEAWFALARAHEESGQVDKAKEVLWWCVELEEGIGVRDWRCLGSGGYTL